MFHLKPKFCFSLLSLILTICFVTGCNRTVKDEQYSDKIAGRLDSLYTHKQFFSARNLLEKEKDNLTRLQQLKWEALVDNVFNRLERSAKGIEQLFASYGTQLPDSVRLQLLRAQQINYGRLGRYKNAFETAATILKHCAHLLGSAELENFRNMARIWSNLLAQPPQSVVINGPVHILMKRDKAGLATLPVTGFGVSLNFIFDTGANLCTTTETNARKLNMRITDSLVNVRSITGAMVAARIAVCPHLYIRGIHLQNTVFIVFPDNALYIQPLQHQIEGIIGFPVIQALGAVQITRANEFIVQQRTSGGKEENMAFDFLTPVINIEGESYTLDTGADETMLYLPYYLKHKKRIDSVYRPEQLRFSGVGGSVLKEGYYIQFSPVLGNKSTVLDSVMLFREHIGSSGDHYYGNIGQDLIKQFEKMTLDFRAMYVGFE